MDKWKPIETAPLAKPAPAPPYRQAGLRGIVAPLLFPLQTAVLRPLLDQCRNALRKS